jgi:hypothetical protein
MIQYIHLTGQITFEEALLSLHPWNYMQRMFAPLPLMLTEDKVKTARIEAYSDKKQSRIDGLQAAADKRYTEANRRINAGFGKLDVIPFGQPIHGARDRNYRDKAGRQIDSGFRLTKEADKFASKAAAAENNNAISSDDPMALEKLTAKLDELEKLQARMKEVNRQCRKEGKENHYPAWALSNNNQNIHRIKDRIAELQARLDAEEKAWTGTGWTAETDLDDNRIRIYFDNKPDESTRSILKGWGFKWAPSAGAWQRQYNRAALYAMDTIAKKLP